MMDGSATVTLILAVIFGSIWFVPFICFLVLFICKCSEVKKLRNKLAAIEAARPAEVVCRSSGEETAPDRTECNTSSKPSQPASAETPGDYQNKSINRSSLPVYTRNDKSGKAGKKEHKISSINVSFGVGVLLLTIVGAVFLSASWNFLSDAGRIITLVVAVVSVFALSYVSGHLLKLSQTGFAFYVLGSFLTPVLIIGLGALNLVGSLSFDSGNGFCICAIASALFMVTGFVGRKIYKSKTYQGILYFGLTWTVIFTGAQSGLSIDGDGAALEGAFIAIALFALVMQIARCFPGVLRSGFQSVYSEIITYIAAFAGLFGFTYGDAGAAEIVGTAMSFAAVSILCFTKSRSWLRYLTPFLTLSLVVSVARAADSADSDYVFVFAGLTVGALFAFYHLSRMRTPVSGILLPLTGFCCMFTASTQFRFAASIAMLVFVALEVSAALTEKREAPSTAELIIASLMFQVASAIALIASGRVSDSSYSVIYMLPVLISAAILLVLRLAGVKFAEAVRLRVVTAVMLFQSLVPGIVIFFITDGADAVIIVLNSFLILLAAALSMRLRSDGEHVSVAFILALTGALNSIAFIAYSLDRVSRIRLMSDDSPVNLLFTDYRNSPHSVLLPVSAGMMFLVFVISLAALKAAGALTERLRPYKNPLKWILSICLCIWLIFCIYDCTGFVPELILATAGIAAVYFCGSRFMTVVPILILEGGIQFFASESLSDYMDGDRFLPDMIIFAFALFLPTIGRIIYRKKVFSKEGVDYLAFLPLFMLTGVSPAPYNPMVPLFIISAAVINLSQRVKIRTAYLYSVALVLATIGLIEQGFVRYEDSVSLEIYIASILADVIIIRYLFRPASEKMMRILWFVSVAIAMTAESVSALDTGEILDLIIVGFFAIVIFIYSFVRKAKTWFILGVSSILGIAVYLSVTFWESIAWVIYLFIAGVILITFAAVNEWGKRHNKDGRNKRFFEEWKW